ncbi:MAG: ADP-forming succinate--CoA ligase subunit beta [Salinisphaera sp.]|nr:ADP-forming succinate--CoA ligase subunit beta [Salinisphaera sp.]
MDIHEHQAKDLLRDFGVPVPSGAVAFTRGQAIEVAQELGGERWAVKAQIHAGARGKAGGIKLCNSTEEVGSAADALLGSNLVTLQTGPAGKKVSRVLIEQAQPSGAEFYIGIILDRALERICVIGSAAGGIEVESNAQDVIMETVDPAVGIMSFQANRLGYRLGLAPPVVRQVAQAVTGAYRAFRDLDATLVEINPLMVTAEGKALALDAKMSFDNNALFRHPEINKLTDVTQGDPREAQAAQHGLSYIGLEGNIGCIVNGAGLAMATMDLIKNAGGEPANFLDIGGGASPERVANAFRLIVSDTQVRAILVNIFAGINRCDWVASGIVQAVKEVGLSVPLVVRLAGTNLAEGLRILRESGLPIKSCEDLGEAAEEAVRTLS